MTREELAAWQADINRRRDRAMMLEFVAYGILIFSVPLALLAGIAIHAIVW